MSWDPHSWWDNANQCFVGIDRGPRLSTMEGIERMKIHKTTAAPGTEAHQPYAVPPGAVPYVCLHLPPGTTFTISISEIPAVPPTHDTQGPQIMDALADIKVKVDGIFQFAEVTRLQMNEVLAFVNILKASGQGASQEELAALSGKLDEIQADLTSIAETGSAITAVEDVVPIELPVPVDNGEPL